MTSSIQVSELAAIIREHMFPLEYVTLQRPDIVRSENAARAILAMRSKDHSIAVDDVERVATAMLAPLGYVGVKSLAEAESIWVGSNIDDAETGSLAYLCRSLARAAITAIGSQSIERERA